MAERIVSPGVFTRERDLSFLPQGIAEIGAAIVGPTLKGPAFVPTIIRNFPEFEEMFGSTDKRFYTPYAVEQYLRSAGTVTVVRVLNTSGYTADSLAIKIGATTAATNANAIATIQTPINEGVTFTAAGTDGTVFSFVAVDTPIPSDVGNTFYFQTGSGVDAADKLSDKIGAANIGYSASYSSSSSPPCRETAADTSTAQRAATDPISLTDVRHRGCPK